MKTVFLFLILSFVWFGCLNPALAQSTVTDTLSKVKPYRNSVYAELGGNAIVGSFNYERIFALPNANTFAFCRLGGLFVPVIKVGGNTAYEFLIPVEISLIHGRKAVKPEIGVGLTYYWAYEEHIIYSDRYETTNRSMLIPVARLGARWHIPNSVYFIRAGFTPLFFGEKARNTKLPFMPFGGVSIGYSFGH
jgi:hypothetical protein